MYILISEDGEVFKCEKLTEDDFNAADGGILNIIDVSGDPDEYYDGKWTGVKQWGDQ